MMYKPLTCAALGMAATLAASGAAARKTAPDGNRTRPNILLILADDMGYSDIGCFGSEIRTPNIDRICNEGMAMTQFYNAARSCPSRAALLTGMYHHKSGVGAMVKPMAGLPAYQGYLNDSCLTIAEALRPAGYSTYMSGKWHLGSRRGMWPSDRGFDRSFVFLEGAGSYFYPNGNPQTKKNMAMDSEYWQPPMDGYYHTDAFTDNAVRFIREDKGDKPFFMYLAYTASHWPLQAFPEDIAKYKGVYDKGWDETRRERYERMVKTGIIDPRWKLSPRDGTVMAWDSLSDADRNYWAQVMEIYAAVIDRMDQGVGKVLAELERKGKLDNTLVIFLSDNGGCMEEAHKFADLKKYTGRMGGPESFIAYEANWANVSDTPFRYFKHWMHEGGIATPFVARWPEMIKAGGRTDRMGHIVDVMATCLELSGADYPTDTDTKLKPLDGTSLVPLFKGIDKPIHEVLFFEHLGFRALRQGDMKIVSIYPDNKWALYDMRADRTELNDLSADRSDVVARMEAIYNDIAARSGVTDWKKVMQLNRKDARQDQDGQAKHKQDD